MAEKISKFYHRVEKYCENILKGSLPSCFFIRKAIERWYNDISRDDLYFSHSDFNRSVAFICSLRHFKGEYAGKQIHLEDWQLFILANIFGWHRKSDNLRRYTYADVFVPRKNGKTTFASAVALYCLLMDGESGAEVYAAAVDREQAKICFDTAKSLIKGSIFEELVSIYTSSIVFADASSSFKPLSKDTKNKDGLNPHATICDERHAWATDAIFELLKTGMGARQQPLIFSISTAGMDTSLPYYRDIEVLKDVMRGIKDKDNHFIMLYMPDDDDRWDNPITWQKVNPNYGISLSAKYMQQEYEDAKLKGGSTLAAFCVKNLNLWVDAPEVWISDDDIVANNADFDESLLADVDCYVGIDLASKNDISAVAFYFPKFQVVKYKFYIPSSKIEEMADRVDYRLWAEEGYMSVCDGKTLDEDWFLADLLVTFSKYKIRNIAYDPWGMWSLKQKFGKYTEQLMEYQQSIRYISVPTKELESMLLRHELNFLHNPVIRWMMKNVVIYADANANIKLNKARSRNKIDGVVALVDALGGYLTKQADSSQKVIYANHNLRTIPSI